MSPAEIRIRTEQSVRIAEIANDGNRLTLKPNRYLVKWKGQTVGKFAARSLADNYAARWNPAGKVVTIVNR